MAVRVIPFHHLSLHRRRGGHCPPVLLGCDCVVPTGDGGLIENLFPATAGVSCRRGFLFKDEKKQKSWSGTIATGGDSPAALQPVSDGWLNRLVAPFHLVGFASNVGWWRNQDCVSTAVRCRTFAEM